MSDRLADLSIDSLKLTGLNAKGKKWSLSITGSITDAEIERSIEGASTLTLTVHDPDWAILNSGLFDRRVDGRLDAVDVQVDTHWFRLVQVAPSDDTLTLTFEDRDVAYLRRHTKYKKVARGKTTRAEFVRSLVKEVKADGGIQFQCPELHKTQPKAKQSEKDANREPGLADHADIKIKGEKADKDQLRNIETVLSVARSVNAGAKAVLALVEACIVESLFRNPKDGEGSSVGILQLTDIHYGGSVDARRDIERVVEDFLKRGFAGRGGAIQLARENDDWTAGEVAQGVQASGHPERYDQYKAEAKDIIDAYGGDAAFTGSSTDEKAFYFTRGEPGTPEDSWTAIQRLASEVNWRAFIVNGTLIFMSEDDLMRSRSRTLIKRSQSEVLSFGFDWDNDKKVAEVNLQIRAERWALPPGTVVDITEAGPANGRWIVSSIRRSLTSDNADVTLKTPVNPFKEPANETDSASSGGSGGASSLRSKIIAEAEKTLTSKTGFRYYSQTGALTTDPMPPKGKRSDCSQWVRAIYLKAGAPDPGTNTSEQNRKGKRTSRPQPGDLVMQPNHVEIYISNSKTIGHGTPPIDYAKPSDFSGHWYVTFDALDG